MKCSFGGHAGNLKVLKVASWVHEVYFAAVKGPPCPRLATVFWTFNRDCTEIFEALDDLSLNQARLMAGIGKLRVVYEAPSCEIVRELVVTRWNGLIQLVVLAAVY